MLVSAATLTFDDTTSLVANAYGGLRWSGFDVLTGARYPSTGYASGMVSPSRVAYNFDQYDRRAYVSSDTAFNFDSAYLTSAFDYYTSGLSNGVPFQIHGLQVEVRGFVGTQLTYDNTYSLRESGPLFIHFGYAGVDKVEFIPHVPGSATVDPLIFVMDNATISTVPEPACQALVGLGAALAWSRALRKK